MPSEENLAAIINRSIWEFAVDRGPDILRKALECLNENFEGREWNKETQIAFAEATVKKAIGLRSKRPTSGLGRAIFANLKFFGLAYEKDGKVSVTPVGKELCAADPGKSMEVFRKQLSRWQFPNPHQKRMSNRKLMPFKACLKILHDLEYISSDEMTLFVVRMNDEKDIGVVKKLITEYRQKSASEKQKIKKMRIDFDSEKHEAWGHIGRYFQLTGLCNIVKENDEERLKLDSNRLQEVETFLSQGLQPIHEFEQESNWFEYYGSVKPPVIINIRVISSERGSLSGAIVKSIDLKTGTETIQTTNETGIASMQLPESSYRLNVVYDNLTILDVSASLEKDIGITVTLPTAEPSPKEVDLAEVLKRAKSLSWRQLEETIARIFEEILGAKEWVEWRGGSGEPDIIVQAPLALDFGRAVIEGTKKGKAGLSLEIPEAQEHARKTGVKARYAVLVSTEPFEERADDRRMLDSAQKYGVILMTINCLGELLRFHRDIGGITHDELKELFDKASPLIDDVINSWEDDVIKNRSSFFLAVEAYGVLMSKADELTLDEIVTELGKKHEEYGEPRIVITPQTVREALEILASLGAITKRGIEYYKALLSSEVFLSRLQKMCGLVDACRGKFRPILLGKGLEKYLK